jgi:hypothetical protein
MAKSERLDVKKILLGASAPCSRVGRAVAQLAVALRLHLEG